MQRVKSDSICSLVISPPPSALSPTPSSLDNSQAGRASSALELEWDDIFADDNPLVSAVVNVVLANGDVSLEADTCTFPPAPPPLPPRHIQEMRRNATKLVRGSYVEESEFQDDVLVYDLIAKKDEKAAILDRIMLANRQSRGSISKGQRVSATATTLTTMLTTTGRTVLETVNSIMSARRRSEDAGKEERRRSEDCEKEIGRTKEGEEEETKRIFGHRGSLGDQLFTNGFNVNNDIIDECDDADDDIYITARVSHTPGAHQQHVHESMQSPSTCLVKNTLTNGHHGSESFDRPISPSLPDDNTNNNDFLSQYCELMLSLGVEPDYEDITEDIDTFRKRVQVLRQRLEEEEEELCTDFGFSSFGDDVGAEEEEEVMREEEEAEKIRSDTKKGGRRHQIPFTGLCLCNI